MKNNNEALKEEKTRHIEMYVGYQNKTWENIFVSIPLNTLEIEKTAMAIAMKLFFNNPNTFDEVAFVGVYNIPEIEESC